MRLFERFDTPRPVGSGLMLQPTGLAALNALGLFNAISGLGARIDRLSGADTATGKPVLDVRYSALGAGSHALAVHRATLFDLLHDAVVAEKIPIRAGFAVATLEREEKSWLRGPQGLEGPFDLVVDALGATSPLRVAARYPGTARPLHYGAVWATVPWVDHGFDRRALSQRYRKASVMIGVLPIGRRRTGDPELAAFFWSLRPDQYPALRNKGLQRWKDSVLRHWPETAPHLDAIGSFDELSLARYAHQTLRVPAGNGIAFVGDSAHSTSPQLGQGANMALLDAAALAAALGEAEDIGEALEVYAGLRRWHVRVYQLLSLSLTPLYQSDSTILPMLRDLLASRFGRIQPMPWVLAAMVSGQLLTPLKALGLETPVLRELAA